MNAAAILRRWDRLAHEQLCAEAARLVEENERLSDELYYALQSADSWREDAMRLQEQACADGRHAPGLTRDGALVLVPIEAPRDPYAGLSDWGQEVAL